MARQKNARSRIGQILSILEKQQYKCALTGEPLTPETATLDHKLAVSRGGSIDDVDNFQVLHTDVNKAKGSMTNEEFISLCSGCCDTL